MKNCNSVGWHGLLALFCMMTIGGAYFSVPAHSGSDDVEMLGNYSLKYSVNTTAKKSTIWRLWSDVENWQDYDIILEYSYLQDNADFQQGAIGYLKARGAPRSKFTLIDVQPGVSFIEKLHVPLYQSIELQRYFEVTDDGTTTFTHEVNFKGRLRFIIYAVAGATFKKELPLVMGRLKALAEKLEHEQEHTQSPSLQ